MVRAFRWRHRHFRGGLRAVVRGERVSMAAPAFSW